MSGLAGAAAALAVAIALTVYFHTGYRTARDVVKHGIAAIVALALVAFVVSDMRHAALTYLGLNPSKPAVEFEIRLPTASCRRSRTPRSNCTPTSTSAWRRSKARSTLRDQSVLRGVVTLDYRTTDRVVVLDLAGRAQCEFKLRLRPSPAVPEGSGHGISPIALRFPMGRASRHQPHDAFAIRYRVL